MSSSFFLSNPVGTSPLLHACHTPCPSYPYYLINLMTSGDDYKSWSFFSSSSLYSRVSSSHLYSNISPPLDRRNPIGHLALRIRPKRSTKNGHLLPSAIVIEKWRQFLHFNLSEGSQDGSMSRLAPGLPSCDRIMKYFSRSDYCHLLIFCDCCLANVFRITYIINVIRIHIFYLFN